MCSGCPGLLVLGRWSQRKGESGAILGMLTRSCWVRCFRARKAAWCKALTLSFLAICADPESASFVDPLRVDSIVRHYCA
jgi:hypothetical protein